MHLIDTSHHDDGLVERRFTFDGIPGVLWTPPAPDDAALPLILLGHPGGLAAMHPRLLGRARSAARSGFASAALELPGSGERPPLPELDAARVELRRAIAAGVLFLGNALGLASWALVLSVWPVILILLGVEVLLSHVLGGEGKLRFHGASVFLLILGMTYRYIFLLLHTANSMFLARQSRTLGTFSGKENRRWLGQALGTTIAKSHQMSEDVYLAMLSRGYRDEGLALSSLAFRRRDFLWVLFALAVASALLWSNRV